MPVLIASFTRVRTAARPGKISVRLFQVNEFRTILADPIQSTVAYVNNNFSIFRSTDQGTNWNEAHQGLAFAGIPVIAVAPSSPSIIYTEYRDKAVYKTTNAGQTWFQTSTFLSCGMICAIGVDHLNPDLVYAFEGVG